MFLPSFIGSVVGNFKRPVVAASQNFVAGDLPFNNFTGSGYLLSGKDGNTVTSTKTGTIFLDTPVITTYGSEMYLYLYKNGVLVTSWYSAEDPTFIPQTISVSTNDTLYFHLTLQFNFGGGGNIGSWKIRDTNGSGTIITTVTFNVTY